MLRKKKGGIFEPGAPLVHMYHGTFLPPTYMHDCSNPEARIGVRVVPYAIAVSVLTKILYIAPRMQTCLIRSSLFFFLKGSSGNETKGPM